MLSTTPLPDETVRRCQQPLGPNPGKLTVSFTGVFVTSIFASTFAFTIGFDQGLDKFWDTWNKGVCDFRPRPSLARMFLIFVTFAETMEGYPTQIRRGILESFHCAFLANDRSLVANPCPPPCLLASHFSLPRYAHPRVLAVITSKVLSTFAICEYSCQDPYHRFQRASEPLPAQYAVLRGLYNDTRRLRNTIAPGSVPHIRRVNAGPQCGLCLAR
jgi:hypothetical protein